LEKIISFIKKNYRSLTGSFLFASVLWLAIKSDHEYTHTIEVPIEISTLSENLVLKNKPPSVLKIQIKGSARSLFVLKFQDEKMALAFPEINNDQVINLLEYKNRLQFPADINVEIVDIISPKFLNIEVDTYLERMIPVKVVEEIKTAAGYLLVDFMLQTDSVLVKGPQSFVAAMPYVETAVVIADGVNLPFERSVKLINSKPDVLAVSPDELNVKFNIEQLVERTIYNVPIQIIGVPADISAEATPTTISVRVKGGESTISAVTKEDIEVIFNYQKSFESGKSNYPMQIKTPNNVSWVETSPQSFNIKLIRKESNI
jgi:hypothetical protein